MQLPIWDIRAIDHTHHTRALCILDKGEMTALLIRRKDIVKLGQGFSSAKQSLSFLHSYSVVDILFLLAAEEPS